MFIPRGKVVHENLATTYVLLDSLVADLCEGGFSGVVEVVLRDTDAHILMAEGNVVGVVEQRGLPGRGGEAHRRSYSRATVPELSARARYERGRISVYSFAPGTALAVAGLTGAEQLYAQLSTVFADLERMISKLARERDRQWFIELSLNDSSTALVHLKDDRCRIITAHREAGERESESGLVNNPALLDLLEACIHTGGTFDVYFRDAADEIAEVALPQPAPAETAGAGREQTAEEIQQPGPAQAELQEMEAAAAEADPIPLSAGELADARFETLSRLGAIEEVTPDAEFTEPIWQPVLSDEPLAEALLEVAEAEQPPAAPEPAAEAPLPATAGPPRYTTGLSAIRSELQDSTDFAELSEAQIMTEVKRLMSEIARTIEDAARAVEQRDSFSIYLRAGQLKVAERYPFLDPFGAEFEYLSGEIAFVGSVAPWEFIEGLTEALRLAVEGVVQASAQGERIHAQVAGDLARLLDRSKAEFVEYGLDGSIEKIIGV
jgi:hypothetical protein